MIMPTTDNYRPCSQVVLIDSIKFLSAYTKTTTHNTHTIHNTSLNLPFLYSVNLSHLTTSTKSIPSAHCFVFLNIATLLDVLSGAPVSVAIRTVFKSMTCFVVAADILKILRMMQSIECSYSTASQTNHLHAAQRLQQSNSLFLHEFQLYTQRRDWNCEVGI